MNYFFGFKGENIKSELQVPLFQNRAPENQKIKLFEAYVLNNRWKVEEVVNSEKKGDFLILNNDLISNEKIYFLATWHCFLFFCFSFSISLFLLLFFYL